MAEKQEQFCTITGLDPQQAQFFLDSAGGDLEGALATFYETVGPTNLGAANQDTTQPTNTGPQTLSGAPADELPAEWRRTAGSSGNPSGVGRQNQGTSRGGGPITSFGDITGSAPARNTRSGGISTLKDIASSNAGSPSGGGDMSEDEDEEEREHGNGPQDLYAGGGKSGLNVQDPAQLNSGKKAAGIVADILKKAKEAGAAAMSSSSSAPQPPKTKPVFQGSAQTLGSDQVPSRVIPPVSAASRPSSRLPGGFPTALAVPNSEEREFDENVEDESAQDQEVEKHLTFWKDGFSIEDGPLLDYEDPRNKQILDAINSGRAPLDLLGVRLNQRVTMRVEKRLSENYTPPPKPPAKPFGGSGFRLGSHLPAPNLVAAPPPAGPVARPGSSMVFEVNNELPVTSIRIRLSDGSRMATRLNHHHTIGDIRRLIAASNPELASRPYILQTTFPSRDLTDDNQTVQEAGVLNANVVQRFA